MSKLSSLTRISREDLQGAPAWVDTLLQSSNEFQEQATAELSRSTFVGSFDVFDLVHATERAIKSPFGAVLPQGVSAVRCQGLSVDSAGKSTGALYTLGIARLDWRPLQARPGDPPRIGVTARFASVAETVESSVAPGAGVALTNNTPANIVSISLTPGVWLLAALPGFSGTPTGTALAAWWGTVSTAANGTDGYNLAQTPTMPTAASNVYAQIPAAKISLTTTTTYYLIAQATFSAGAVSAFGRFTAVRLDVDPATKGRVRLRFDGGN